MIPLRPLLLPAPLMLAPLLLAACADFPQLDAAITDQGKAAPDPELVDYRIVLDRAASTTITEATEQDLGARSQALQSQAADMQGAVLTEAERAELTTANERLRKASARVAPES